MSRNHRTARIIAQLELLAGIHDQAATLVREIAILIESEANPGADKFSIDAVGNRHRFGLSGSRKACLIVDRDTLSICWRGNTCFLGNTLAFWFFERLSRRPGSFLSHQQLLDDVWDGIRSKEAIRSVVKVLRQKLREAGMNELANAIDGSNYEHYRLTFPVQT